MLGIESQFGKGIVNGFASAAAQEKAAKEFTDSKDRINYGAIALDVFANEIANSFVEGAKFEDRLARLDEETRRLYELVRESRLDLSREAALKLVLSSGEMNWMEAQASVNEGVYDHVDPTVQQPAMGPMEAQLALERERAIEAYRQHVQEAVDKFSGIEKRHRESGTFGSEEYLLDINSEIVTTYAEIARENGEFLWAKLAAPVAYEVREGLIRSFEMRDNPLSVGPIDDLFQGVENELIGAQMDVYMDVVPLFQVYKEHGADAAVFAARSIYQSDRRALSDVVSTYENLGRANIARNRGDLETASELEYSASRTLLRHEQRDILQPLYDNELVDAAFEANAGILHATFGLFGQKADIDVAPGLTIETPGVWDGYDITDYQTRWAVADHALGEFTRWYEVPVLRQMIDNNISWLENRENHVQPLGE